MSDTTDDILAALAAAYPGQRHYPPMERYTDFRAVFLGSDQGRRVLAQIMIWGNAYRSSVVGHPIDANHVLFREGERSLALAILRTADKEPQARPAHAATDEDTLNNG